MSLDPNKLIVQSTVDVKPKIKVNDGTSPRVTDVRVNGESVVTDRVAEITIPYEKVEELDNEVAALEDKVTLIEEGVTVYNYFYWNEDTNKITLPLAKTTFLLREYSPKGVLSDDLTDCYLRVYNGDEPFIIDEEGNRTIFHTEEDFNLYQTGLSSEIKTERYGYDNVDAVNQVVNRYCYVMSLPDLIKSFSSTEWSWSGTGSANGRLSISHEALADIGIFTENGIAPKYTTDIGLTYKGISTQNFAISNLKSIEGITNKATAISILSSATYDDVLIVFKRISPIQEPLSKYGIHFEITEVECDGLHPIEIGNFAGCVQASYISLKDLVYDKEQADEKFLSKVDYNASEHIVKIGDPETNELEATFDIYNVTLKGLGYPKYACAKCVAKTSGVEAEALPFLGDTFFINAIRDNVYGYEVHNAGKRYWLTKTSVEEEVPINKSLLTNNANKVLQVNSSGTGLTVTTLPSSGTRLYKHDFYSSNEDGPFVIIDNNPALINLENLGARLLLALAYGFYGIEHKAYEPTLETEDITPIRIICCRISGPSPVDNLFVLKTESYSLQGTITDTVTQL